MTSVGLEENIFQAAYKRGRCTQEHVLRLTEDVNLGFIQKQSTIAVFLDVEGAFDRVWIKGLLWKILQMGLPKNLVSVIWSFLNKRSLKVKVGEESSAKVTMQAGTPQGAVLSPTLYNIFVDDLKECLGEGIHLAQYADDVALWISDTSPARAERRMNACLLRLANWTVKWRIKLAPEKSVFMLFSRRPTHQRMSFDLKLFGQTLKRVESHRFLGVRFDERLAWKQYILEIIGSAMPRVNALKSLAAKSIWRRPDWILKLHEAVVNSVWKYGCIAYSGMGQHLWDRLKRVHSQCIKSYTGVPQYVGYETII